MAAHPYTIALLFLSRHPRIKGRLMQLQTHFHNPSHSGDSNPLWESYTSSLMCDCLMAYFLCAHMLSVSTTILYYGPEEAATASVAAVTACMSTVGLVHVCCIRWHLQIVHQNPDAFEYWCKTSASHRGSTYKQTESLLAAPIAWILWTVASFVLLMGLVIQHFPVPICVDDNIARGNHTSDVLNDYIGCRTLKSAPSPTHLPQSSRVVTIVILLVGTLHVSFNMFYFTMLGVPEGNALPERHEPPMAVSSGSLEGDTPTCATLEVDPDVLSDVRESFPPHEDLPSDSEVQDDISSKQRRHLKPNKRASKSPSCNVHIKMLQRKRRPG